MRYLFIEFVGEEKEERGIVKYYKYGFSNKDEEIIPTENFEIFNIKNVFDNTTGKTEKSFTSGHTDEPEISLLYSAFTCITFGTSFKNTKFKFTFEDSNIFDFKIIKS